MSGFTPYLPRAIRFLEVWRLEGWQMKAYSLASGRELARPELTAAAKITALERLRCAGSQTSSYQVGFVGIHDGKTANFVFVDWWADENELHHHVYVSPSDQPERLEYKTPTGLAACVWDMALMAFEREAWVQTILKAERPDFARYLSQRMNADV